ncbi:TetR family transcriptional regulator [Pimelobacter simplex]|uniref:TetR family transcriptional regulator n=1 Tax=Nocardioides simplex TaxID=2045 RepID=A0A7J5DZD5_NOCSI|nr:TetR family transcriptional regulator [Pimelobacter simplex]KAB2811391.1 TetR family transcriptional regulator [Pimelobacter simplex]
MARRPPDSATLLGIARACADVFVAAGDSSPTVAALVAASGVSERSFHRYFPTKADCLRPLFDDGNDAYAAALAAQPAGLSLGEAVTRAFVAANDSMTDDASRAFMRTVFGDLALRRVWLEASYATAEVLRPAVAARIGAPERAVATTVACGQAIVLAISALAHMVEDGLTASEAAAAAGAALFAGERHE